MSWISKLTGVHINPIKGEYSVDWNTLRDRAEAIGVTLGNIALPGSSLLTSKLASKGAQEQLNSPVGILANLGTTYQGIQSGNLSNYGFGNSAGKWVTGAEPGTSAVGSVAPGAAGAAGAGAAGTTAAATAAPNFLAQYGGPLATLASSIYGASAAKSAAETQAQAQRDANALQYQMYQQSRADLAPYTMSGIPATNALLTRLGLAGDTSAAGYGSLTKPFSMADYQADPGYAFRLAEGTKALERSAAARGGLLSGGALRESQRYGQDLASQEYQNAYNRYMAQNLQQYNMLAEQQRLGQSAAAGQAAQASNYGAAGAAGLTNIGAALAAGTMGAANAYSQGAQGLLNYYSGQNALDQYRRSTYAPATPKLA